MRPRQGSFLIDLWSFDWLLIISHIKGRSSWSEIIYASKESFSFEMFGEMFDLLVIVLINEESNFES